MEKIYSNCQSCSMPLKNDPNGGGTNADGSKSTMYCSNCYQKGIFTHPNMSVTEMQAFVKDKLKEIGGIHRLFAGLFSRGIPKLERWKNH